MISKQQLDSFVGQTISKICPNKFHDNKANHCAHFVSHVLNLHFGFDCKQFKGGTEPGANIRVHEIFAHCPKVTEITQTTTSLKGIIFVSASKNFVTRGGKVTLKNVPKKHVGLLLGGIVWHYSNPIDKVITQPMSQFLFHYKGQANSMWHGTFPAGARAIGFQQC